MDVRHNNQIYLSNPLLTDQENAITEIMATLAQLSTLVFVIGMASMGQSLKVSQIIAPLKNVKPVLLANFVLVPIVAFVLTLIFSMDESLNIGLILLAIAAGAPFLPSWLRSPRTI